MCAFWPVGESRRAVASLCPVLEFDVRVFDQFPVPDWMLCRTVSGCHGSVLAFVFNSHQDGLPELPGLRTYIGEYHNRVPLPRATLGAACAFEGFGLVARERRLTWLVLSGKRHVCSTSVTVWRRVTDLPDIRSYDPSPPLSLQRDATRPRLQRVCRPVQPGLLRAGAAVSACAPLPACSLPAGSVSGGMTWAVTT